MSLLMKVLPLFLLIVLTPLVTAAEDDLPEYGVYEYVVRNTSAGFEATCSAINEAVENSSFVLLTTCDVEGPKDCGFRSTVYAIYEPDYAKALLGANRRTSPFAIVDRINVFEDEEGTHISIVNPLSINRTILMDDTTYSELSNDHRLSLRSLITETVAGEASDKQYGEFRNTGYIGRTFGIMAGGDYSDKINDIMEIEGGNLDEVIEKLQGKMADSVGEWGMQLAYTLNLPEEGIAVLGTTGTSMASKSYSIVKAGGDKTRKNLSCPGLAYAGAYPIEVVVSRDDNGTVKVSLCHIMYRMKMYFEDAGKWAFAKNMDMPGSIQDELKDQIHAALR